jgi:DNA-binding beta-propeller fold protein YncE
MVHTLWTAVLILLLLPGCQGSVDGAAELVWGSPGLQPGQFVRPRGLAVSHPPLAEEVYVVDFAGRIQVFDLDGKYLRGWQTPSIINGRPGGISIAPDGNVLVPDSHYQRLLVYTPTGQIVREIVGTTEQGGLGPFGYISDVVQDREGNLFMAEFGDVNRVRQLSPAGLHLGAFGTAGDGPGQLARPRGLALGPRQEIVVADSCNHRLQIFARDGRLLRSIGRAGTGPGEFSYPYKVAVAPSGDIIVAEFGNHRVQRLTWDGKPLAQWGRVGRGPGCLAQPWGVAVDSRGRVYIADTENHRIQRVRL